MIDLSPYQRFQLERFGSILESTLTEEEFETGERQRIFDANTQWQREEYELINLTDDQY